MLDAPSRPEDGPEILPVQKLKGTVAGVYAALGQDFETRRTEALSLGFEGIPHDIHAGLTRKSGSREPWYPRGTEMRNERQLTIVAPDELAIVAERMELAEILPEWIGANLVLDGVPRLSMLPSGTLLFFEGGVTLKVDAQNHPCRDAGRMIARRAAMADEPGGTLLFPKNAKRLRGLTAWVEKPGTIRAGENVSVRVPEQWIYTA